MLRCLGHEHIILITDAMAGAGLPDGTYDLVGAFVIVKDGQARRPNVFQTVINGRIVFQKFAA